MAQLFHPSFNSIAKLSLAAVPLFLGAVAWAWGAFLWSPYVTGVGVPVQQPVQFTHEHHVCGLGIDCRYCHTSVENSSFAGIPPTHTCMTCHSQIWADSPLLAPVRESYRIGQSAAVAPGARPARLRLLRPQHPRQQGDRLLECHGRVDLMPLMDKTQTLTCAGAWIATATRRSTSGRKAKSTTWPGSAPADQAELGRTAGEAVQYPEKNRLFGMPSMNPENDHRPDTGTRTSSPLRTAVDAPDNQAPHGTSTSYPHSAFRIRMTIRNLPRRALDTPAGLRQARPAVLGAPGRAGRRARLPETAAAPGARAGLAGLRHARPPPLPAG